MEVGSDTVYEDLALSFVTMKYGKLNSINRFDEELQGGQ